MSSRLAAETVEGLDQQLSGEAIGPRHPVYEEARRIWNGMIDRRPAVVARCRSATDVQTALTFAREHELLIAVRGGGHSAPGHSTCDGGIVIDLSQMNHVTVDPERRIARCGGGTTWGQFDRAAEQHGLAVTGGRVSDTGVAGLTLGSGSGWLGRKFGVTCESLIGAEVVTAGGELVRCSETERFDLLWGLRGGGGNFGVVTEFVFRLHPIGDKLFGGMILHHRAAAGPLSRFYRDFMEQAPDEVGGGLVLVHAPDLDLVPEELRSKPAAGIFLVYVGDPAAAESACQPVLEWGEPLLKAVAPVPYSFLQAATDARSPRGSHDYFKFDYLRALSDEAIDTFVAEAERFDSPLTQVMLEPLGGRLARADQSKMAQVTPGVGWAWHCLNLWKDPADDERQIGASRAFAQAMEPHSLGQALPNFLAFDDSGARLRASYGDANYERLVALKDRYDPENRFRLNQNIPPSGWAAPDF